MCGGQNSYLYTCISHIDWNVAPLFLADPAGPGLSRPIRLLGGLPITAPLQ